MKLVYTKDNLDHKAGDTVWAGDQVILSSGERCIIESIYLPTKAKPKGSINVSWDDADRSSFYPTVINAKWVDPNRQ